MRRKWKNRLGVSTVIANMLMILITLSLAAILVAWAGTSYGAFTGGTQVYFAQREQALQERFVIEEVFFNKASSLIFVFVRNVGALQVNVVAIYVNGSALTPQTGTGLCTIPTLLTIQGSNPVCEFSLNWTIQDPNCSRSSNPTWCTGDVFNIVVTSARGNQAAYVARGP